LSVLNGKRVIAAVPFQTLETQPKGNAIGGRDGGAGLRCTALRVCVIEPQPNPSKGGLQIVESNVNVAFGVVSIFRNDVAPGPCQKSDRQLADSHIEVLNAGSVAAHVQWIEVVNLDMLPAVISFPGPEFRVGLALQNVARTYKGFPQSELVISGVTRKICI